MVNVTYDACKYPIITIFTDPNAYPHTHPRSWLARLVRPGRTRQCRLQPWRHRLGPRIHRPRVDHDSRCWFLLLWPPPEEKRSLNDMALDDGPRRRFFPSQPILLLIPLREHF